MGKQLLGILLLITGFVAVSRPWVGITSYYLLAILGPQYIWWWVFEELRVSLIVALIALLGVGFQLVKKNYDFSFLLNRQNRWLAILWLAVTCSYFFGPFVSSFRAEGLRPDQLFSITNTIFLFYFCASLEMNIPKKLRYLGIVFAISTIYLIYWANSQYLSQNWNQFNMGRLMGPSSIHGGSIYRDENAFSMLFVTGLPFIYYLGFELKRRWQQLALWAVVPFGWHAIFLTGSRGGLLGTGVVIIAVLLFANRKKLVIPLVVLFVLFYQWQAGDTMKSRSETIVGYEGESSAEQRIVAWKGGVKMLADHPFTGVGLGSFITALPHYIESKPRVAHNTLVQFAAESGVIAGVAYLMVIWLFYKNFLSIRQWCLRNPEASQTRQVMLYNQASTTSFAGLVVCSMFLSLNTYEIFFVLLLFNNGLLQYCNKQEHHHAISENS